MALINCPQCGHMISDKAKACPKCGYVLNNEQAKPVENIDDEESESQFDDCTPQQGGGLKWILIVLAILVIGGGVGYYFYADNKAKKEIALAAEQARLDSIEAARLDSIEAARLDSIRQDSIERASFTSPDLSFHDLHGDVKRCDNENYESLKDPYSKGTYSFITFDENGRWTNVPQWSAYSKKLCPETTKHPLFERNNKGYIIRRFWGLCDSDGGSIDYIWKDGKLIHNQDEVYSNDGLLISDNSDAEGYVFHTTYYNYKVDGIGNWVKRDYVTSTSYSYGSGEIESYEFGTETRKITYYKSDGGKLISIPNNAKQEQAVKTAKAFNKTKEQESYSSINDYDSDSNYQSSHDSRRASFSSPNDVMAWLSGKTFSGGGVSVKFDYNTVYINGSAVSGAPRVSNITSSTATILASSPYMGGQDLRFYLNANSGTISLDSGERLYLR